MNVWNDIRALIAIQLLDWALTVAPDDGLKVELAKRMSGLGQFQIQRKGLKP